MSKSEWIKYEEFRQTIFEPRMPSIANLDPHILHCIGSSYLMPVGQEELYLYLCTYVRLVMGVSPLTGVMDAPCG